MNKTPLSWCPLLNLLVMCRGYFSGSCCSIFGVIRILNTIFVNSVGYCLLECCVHLWSCIWNGVYIVLMFLALKAKMVVWMMSVKPSSLDHIEPSASLCSWTRSQIFWQDFNWTSICINLDSQKKYCFIFSPHTSSIFTFFLIIICFCLLKNIYWGG